MIIVGYILCKNESRAKMIVLRNFTGHNKHDTDTEPKKSGEIKTFSVVSIFACGPLQLLFSCYYILGGPTEKTVFIYFSAR